MIKLIIALHGVGSSAADLAPAVAELAAETGIEVLALDGPARFDMALTGRQWFSVKGITEETRPARVTAALPVVLAQIDEICGKRGLQRAEVGVLGFSQGAIIALAVVATGARFGSIVAIAGRLAAPVLPVERPRPSIALIHDRLDQVMPIALADQAEEALRAAGHDVRLTITEGYGHAIGPRTIEAAAASIIDASISLKI